MMLLVQNRRPCWVQARPTASATETTKTTTKTGSLFWCRAERARVWEWKMRACKHQSFAGGVVLFCTFPISHCISSTEMKILASYRGQTMVTPIGAIPSLEMVMSHVVLHLLHQQDAFCNQSTGVHVVASAHPYTLDGHEFQDVLDASRHIRSWRVAPTTHVIFNRRMYPLEDGVRWRIVSTQDQDKLKARIERSSI